MNISNSIDNVTTCHSPASTSSTALQQLEKVAISAALPLEVTRVLPVVLCFNYEVHNAPLCHTSATSDKLQPDLL